MQMQTFDDVMGLNSPNGSRALRLSVMAQEVENLIQGKSASPEDFPVHPLLLTLISDPPEGPGLDASLASGDLSSRNLEMQRAFYVERKLINRKSMVSLCQACLCH